MIFSFLSNFFIKNFYNLSVIYSIKLSFHTILFSFIFDIFSIYFIFPIYEEKSNDIYFIYYNELKFLRKIVLINLIIIIIIKLILIYFLISNFNKYPKNENYLKNFDYKNKTDPNQQIKNFMNFNQMNLNINNLIY